ncbi:MAG: tRNA (adenosine(37)-N6)-threonylcarbamoyltransferase complex transferase subunit TsaD [Clostridiales bacterium GWF2_38_85]|nr:MAG: tRNA (adenosine(37)-N6)-threonylcarbamoyltransferase complex transferase subunit TsaD [Clostridiales bacterium GWF2_38_85]HBL84775.1 tRNA (adenosine(37)-N6)-threonylcarbamoyltransferase complex transferase subunit TsaD [Clostridiales bacterium]
MRILAIETSCDETSAAVVEDGRELLSNVVASQINIHALYGGVVPEIASRAHTEALSGTVAKALTDAEITVDELDAVAVTNTPGLIGALLTGVSFAKGLAFSAQKPLIAVHHIRSHIAANYIARPELKPPFYALVVSGGHTSILAVDDYTEYRTIGQTRDDAAGEALDKAARVLGLPYPGGASMDKLAFQGDIHAIPFSISKVNGSPYDFSFSGLKTSVINYTHTLESRQVEIDEKMKTDIAASYMNALVNNITSRLEVLIQNEERRPIVLAGGVAASKNLRNAISTLCGKYNVEFYFPPISLCGDNAAMVGAQAFFELQKGNISDMTLNAFATSSAD